MELVSCSSPLRYSSFGAILGGRVGHLPQEFASKSPLGLCYYESTHTLLINANFQVSGEFLSLDRRPMVVSSSLKTTLSVRFVGCVDNVTH